MKNSVLVLSLIVAQRAAAQTCLGQAGFEGGSWRAGASYGSLPSPNGGTNATQVAGQLAYGSPEHEPFAQATVARISAGSLNSTTSAIAAGISVPVDVGAFCPLVSVEHQVLPSQQVGGVTASGTANQFSFGAGVGFPVKLTPTSQWRPFGTLSFEDQRGTGTLTSGGISSNSTSSTTFAEFEGGIGFVLGLHLTIRPSFVYDFLYSGQVPDQQKYILAVSYNFGPGSKTPQ